MIGSLSGVLVEWEGSTALVEVNGVGYEVTVPESVAVSMGPCGSVVSLRIRQVFREDGSFLYGFLDSAQRRLFDLLVGVNGCGPKVALALLGQLGEGEVIRALQAQDSSSLRRASGVGPKLADRLVVELKDKIHEEALNRRGGGLGPVSVAARVAVNVVEDELVDALMGLGYKRQESEQAAQTAREQSEKVEDQLRLALKELRK